MAQVEGPKVTCAKDPMGWEVRVTSSYRVGDQSSDKWRGMVTISFMENDILDIEGSLKDGQNGLWFAPPSRSYEDGQGNTKWKNLVWFHSKNLAATCVQAVQEFLDDDDLPM